MFRLPSHSDTMPLIIRLAVYVILKMNKHRRQEEDPNYLQCCKYKKKLVIFLNLCNLCHDLQFTVIVNFMLIGTNCPSSLEIN